MLPRVNFLHRWAATREVVSTVNPSADELAIDLHALCICYDELDAREAAGDARTVRLLATSVEAITKSKDLLGGFQPPMVA